MKLEVVTAVNVKITTFWNVTECGVVPTSQRNTLHQYSGYDSLKVTAADAS
jgi:hypothetical protein